jgi:hypothetical protein
MRSGQNQIGALPKYPNASSEAASLSAVFPASDNAKRVTIHRIGKGFRGCAVNPIFKSLHFQFSAATPDQSLWIHGKIRS